MSLKYKLIAFAVGRMVDMKFLQGYKTYIVCAATIMGSLAAYVNGEMTLATFIQTFALALSGITISAKINRNAKVN